VNFPSAILNAFGRRNASQITTLFIHHTVMVPTADVTEVDAVDRGRGGFLAIGYNAYVKSTPGGWVVQQARPLNVIPAAQYGMNTEGYAIAVGGNYQPGGAPFLTPYDPAVLPVIAAQVAAVKKKCPNLRYLCAHRDVATIMEKRGLDPGLYSTACCGDDLYAHLDELRTLVGLAKYPGLP